MRVQKVPQRGNRFVKYAIVSLAKALDNPNAKGVAERLVAAVAENVPQKVDEAGLRESLEEYELDLFNVNTIVETVVKAAKLPKGTKRSPPEAPPEAPDDAVDQAGDKLSRRIRRKTSA